MADRRKRYESDQIAVTYDLKRCLHAAKCVQGLPSVFNAESRPWVDPAQATPDEVAAAVQGCPTGALQFYRKDGGQAEAPTEKNEITVSVDGPLYIRGNLQLNTPEGPRHETRAALCRCGRSNNKPYCDDSHFDAGFHDAGEISDNQLQPLKNGEAVELELAPAPRGPMILRGPVTLRSADGATCFEGSTGALCRCGGSSNKPFCDGTHSKIGFDG